MNKCKICNGCLELFSQATILSKYRVKYYKCAECGFIQTEAPFWLNEAYQSPINKSDLGLLNRNLTYAKITGTLISVLFNKDGLYLDYGGGYGVLTRMMRDLGYNFYHYDPYCDNIFALGFEANLESRAKFDMVTAFELFEHLSDPLLQVDSILEYTDSLLFSTELLPVTNPKPDEWRYYGLEHGQHISFYTLKSLQTIADIYKINFYSNQTTLHLFSKKRIAPVLFKLLSKYRIAELITFVNKRESLLSNDYNMVANSASSDG